jgi:hypothetical protein
MPNPTWSQSLATGLETRGRQHRDIFQGPAEASGFLCDCFKEHILSEDPAFGRSLQVVEA